ncbi:MAG: hypothetical protein RLZZ238_1465 [Planctomycetota bacterium]
MRAMAVLPAVFAGGLWPDRTALAQGIYADEALDRGIDYFVSQGMFSGNGQFGCGVALVDLDGDGDDDLVCLGAIDDRLGFFENDGTGHFTDVTAKTGLGLVSRASGIAAGDFDADGDLDLAVTRWLKSTALLRNDGGMHFTDVSSGSGVTGAGAGGACAWADFDGDGWIDLAVANRTGTLFNQSRNRLFRNNRDGTFTDVAAALGVDNGGWPAFTVTWCDFDLDGDQDLYVGNDKGTSSPFNNRMYRNNGDGTFTEDHGCRADVRADAMGTAVGDLNHDGVPEIYVSNVSLGNILLTSITGGNEFIRIEDEAGVTCNRTSWGAAFIDPDSDGVCDLFVGSQTGANFMFKQGASWPLFDAAELWGLDDARETYCIAVGDIDRDGDPDIVVQNHQHRISLMVNNLPPQPTRRWIEFRAMGRGANTHGIGTRIVATVDGRRHWCEVAAGTGYKSQSTYRQRIGLGAVSVVDEVEVAFPRAGELSAAIRVLRSVPTNLEWPLWPPEALGDADGDGVRSDADRAHLATLVGSPCTPALAKFDVDGDSELTKADLAEFDRIQCDLDGDLRVGARDIAILLYHWGEPQADFDGSGATDPADLARLLASWTEG